MRITSVKISQFIRYSILLFLTILLVACGNHAQRKANYEGIDIEITKYTLRNTIPKRTASKIRQPIDLQAHAPLLESLINEPELYESTSVMKCKGKQNGKVIKSETHINLWCTPSLSPYASFSVAILPDLRHGSSLFLTSFQVRNKKQTRIQGLFGHKWIFETNRCIYAEGAMHLFKERVMPRLHGAFQTSEIVGQQILENTFAHNTFRFQKPMIFFGTEPCVLYGVTVKY